MEEMRQEDDSGWLVVRSGRYRLKDRDFETVYLLEDLYALHQYNYPCRIRCGGSEYEIAPGDVTVTPPGMKTTYALEQEGVHLCAHFAAPLLPELPFVIRAGLLPPYWTAAFDELVDLMQLTCTPERQQAAKNMIWLLLYRLKNIDTGMNAIDRRIRRLLYELNLHSDRPLDVAYLAKKYNLSQTHLSRLFKKYTNQTIASYVMRCRIEKARFLITGTTRSIKDIAMAVGYGSSQEFNKRFHQIEGIPPSSLR